MPICLKRFSNRRRRFLGHKHRSSDHRKVFEDKDIFKDVINDAEVFEGELSEDQIPF